MLEDVLLANDLTRSIRVGTQTLFYWLLKKETVNWNWRDNTMIRTFTWHACKRDLISDIPNGLQIPPGAIPEGRVRSNPENCWMWPKNPNNINNNKTQIKSDRIYA